MNKEERRRKTIEKYGKVVKYWTEEEIEKLKRLFPDNVTEELCDVFQRSKTSIYNKAKRLGLEKSEAFLLKHCNYSLAKQREITKTKLSGKAHWNHGQKRPSETIEKIKDAHFKLPIEHQKYYALTGIGDGEDEFAQTLAKHKIEYEHQKILLGKYIADFYLPEYNLIVEVDGVEHNWGRIKKNDAIRDREIMALGMDVVRISVSEAKSGTVPFILEGRSRKKEAWCRL